MAAIQSMGELTSIRPHWQPGIMRQSVSLYDSFNYEYAALYRMQPNVRTCVDFLARNVAQLGLHVFRRISDTDRERLAEHGLAMLLATPLPAFAKVTRYRLVEALMSDLGIYFNAYWLKLRQDGQMAGLLRLPPVFTEVEGGLIPTKYRLTIGGKRWEFPPDEVVHFRGYNPENAVAGLSPLETLRRVLAEEHASGKNREGMWQNAARIQGIIQRPAEAPEWSPTARERFRSEFEQLYSGSDNAGKTAVLEDGMEWVEAQFDAQEMEYLGARKLNREECARSYHIPLPMVGILDHATFSNIEEQHKNLYQDSLGPWLKLIEQDVELQLLPEFEDTERVYTEFNIAEKMRGSFEEQAQGLQTSVGRPWMTANEARARMNLPSLDGDADRLVTPLNVIVGGQASPRDSAPETAFRNDHGGHKANVKRFDSHADELRRRHEGRWTEVLARHYRRQEAAIASRVPKAVGANGHNAKVDGSTKVDLGDVWYDEERWNEELGDDLLRLNNMTATAWAERMIEQGAAEIEDMDAFQQNMLPWLEEHSRVQAAYMNGQVRDQLQAAIRDPEAQEAVRDLFATAASVWAVRQAVSGVTTAGSFGAHEAANAGGLRTKTWRVNSSNPRPSHQALNGETVGIRERFSNGGRWPGDPALPAEENANCMCSVEFSE